MDNNNELQRKMGERIQYALKVRGMKQIDLAKKTGLSRASISQYVSGRNDAKQTNTYLMAEALDVSPFWLMGLDVEMSRKDKMLLTKDEQDIIDKFRLLDQHGLEMVHYVLNAEFERVQQVIAASRGESVENSTTIAVPILQSVMSGIEIGTVHVDASKRLQKYVDELCAVKITRDTMAPRFSPGDTIIYKKQNDVKSGEIAVVIIDGAEAVCKLVIKEKDNIKLMPLNPKYEPQVFSLADVKKKRVEIVGRVVENIQAV